jgi:TonB family protein
MNTLPAYSAWSLHDRTATLSVVGSILAHALLVGALLLAGWRSGSESERFGSVAVSGVGEDTLFFLLAGGSAAGDPGDAGLPSLSPAGPPEESPPPLVLDETAAPALAPIEEPTGVVAEGEGVVGGAADSTGLAAAGGDGGNNGEGGLGGEGGGTGFGIGPGGGGGAGSPRPLHLVVPRIPRGVSTSRARGESVVLLLAVLPDGSVGDTRIERASRIPALNAAAIDAARRMRYVPARTDDLRWARAEMRF